MKDRGRKPTLEERSEETFSPQTVAAGMNRWFGRVERRSATARRWRVAGRFGPKDLNMPVSLGPHFSKRSPQARSARFRETSRRSCSSCPLSCPPSWPPPKSRNLARSRFPVSATFPLSS